MLEGIRFPRGRLSISVGLACRSFDARTHPTGTRADDDESEALFRAADAALYTAKNAGRNCVSVS